MFIIMALFEVFYSFCVIFTIAIKEETHVEVGFEIWRIKFQSFFVKFVSPLILCF